MVQALVNISEQANQVLNIVKAKYNLKDKSQAIEVIAQEYEDNILEPQFKPAFIAKMQRIRKGKFTKVNSLNELLK